MKAEELQVGDLIVLKFGGEYPDEVRIVKKEDMGNICFLRCANPIEITEKLLENNGFKKIANEYSRWVDSENGWIELEEFGKQYILSIDNGQISLRMPVSSVHELQHALNLCKTNKDIVYEV